MGYLDLLITGIGDLQVIPRIPILPKNYFCELTEYSGSIPLALTLGNCVGVSTLYMIMISQCKIEGSTLANFRFWPDTATMPLQDA